MKDPMQKYDLRHYPLRGLLSEVARERGTTRQAVAHAMKRRCPAILEILASKAEERLRKTAELPRIKV